MIGTSARSDRRARAGQHRRLAPESGKPVRPARSRRIRRSFHCRDPPLERRVCACVSPRAVASRLVGARQRWRRRDANPDLATHGASRHRRLIPRRFARSPCVADPLTTLPGDALELELPSARPSGVARAVRRDTRLLPRVDASRVDGGDESASGELACCSIPRGMLRELARPYKRQEAMHGFTLLE